MDKKNYELYDAFFDFMPNFYSYINPVMNSEDSKDYKFSENQVKVLMCVLIMDDPSPMMISQAMNIQRGSITAIIKSLVQQGMIMKEVDNEDERSYHLMLTEAGNVYINYKEQANRMEINALFDGLEAGEQEQMIESVKVINKYCDKLTRGGKNANNT